MTLREALAWAAGRLAEVPELGPTAARDAELLLMHAAGVERVALYSDPDRMLEEREWAVFPNAVERRIAMEPVQYITGRQEFYGFDLMVSPATLIPRPETELVVEAAVAELRSSGARPPRILDVGTGTGAIAIVMSKELPGAEVVAVDLSEAALDVARENARRHGVEGRISFVASDLLEALRGEAFDAVLSNPPYVPVGDRAGMHPQVRDWEPEMALFAGEDGLDIYRRLIPAAAKTLRPGGLLAMEFGYGQSESLAELLAGWDEVRFLKDLQAILRAVLARKTD